MRKENSDFHDLINIFENECSFYYLVWLVFLYFIISPFRDKFVMVKTELVDDVMSTMFPSEVPICSICPSFFLNFSLYSFLRVFISIYLSFFLSIYLPIYFYLSIYVSIFYLSIYVSIFYLSIYVSIFYLSIYVSIFYLCIYFLFIYLSPSL